MNCNIVIVYPKTGEYKFVSVKGYLVKSILAPDIKFFAHRPYAKDKEDNFESYWNISEYKSGLSLVSYCIGTKAQALHAMEDRLTKIKY
jgi:hypothetical protein